MRKVVSPLLCLYVLSVVEGCDWVYENKCYHYIETKKTFMDAQNECQDTYQANLVGTFIQ